MFTCIFLTQKYQGFRPDRVCFHMSRHVRPTYGTLSTMTNSRCNGVDATVNACTGFTYLCDVHAVLYMQLYFPTIRKDFHRNAQNSICMQYFSADELTKGVKNTQQPPSFLKLHTCLFFLLLGFGVGTMSYATPYTQ